MAADLFSRVTRARVPIVLLSIFWRLAYSSQPIDSLNPMRTYSTLTEYYENEGYDADIPGVQVLMPEQTQKYNAVCLDGSVPDFYYRQGTGDGVKKFILYLQGGGWCATLDQCAQHTGSQLGSSKYDGNYSNIAAGAPYLSSNQTTNPLTYNWNSIFIRYVCITKNKHLHQILNYTQYTV